jgi:type IV secretion system protein VirB11
MLNNNELKQVTSPIREYLNNPLLLDLCINKPGEVYVQLHSGWECYENPEITESWLKQFIKASTVFAKQVTNAQSPILSTTLFSGERLQAVMPPASLYPCVTIRRPSDKLFSIEELDQQGAFKKPVNKDKKANNKIILAKQIFDSGNVLEFLKFAVLEKLNIIVAGATGSGKTTFTKALIREIPLNERLITIEDAAELELLHKNVVRLFYAREIDNKTNTYVTAKDLLISCLRMKPDRIMLSEIRDEEAYYFLRNVNSGHPGSITSIHANTPRQAIDQLTLMIKQSRAGAGIPKADIYQLVRSLVDIIIQWDNWAMSDVFFPALEMGNV